MTRPLITINEHALRENIAHAKSSFAPAGSLMVAVKSNAYGLGVDLVAPLVVDAGADELAVLDIPTGVAIRPLVPNTPLFAWLLGIGDDYAAAAKARLELGISSLWQLEKIAEAGHPEPVRVHLKIDTGLHRNGATATQWPGLVQRAAKLESDGVIRVRAIWSHLADTSVAESELSLTRLHDAVQVAAEHGVRPDIVHLAASHAAVELPAARLDMVRLGILGYGVSPFDDHTAGDLGFQPVLTLWAPVSECRPDGTLQLAVGFADGLLGPSPEAVISVATKPYRVIEVGPEHTVIRPLKDAAEVREGDQVAIFGATEGAPSVEQWASWCQTIGDEVLAKLHPSIERRLVS